MCVCVCFVVKFSRVVSDVRERAHRPGKVPGRLSERAVRQDAQDPRRPQHTHQVQADHAAQHTALGAQRQVRGDIRQLRQGPRGDRGQLRQVQEQSAAAAQRAAHWRRHFVGSPAAQEDRRADQELQGEQVHSEPHGLQRHTATPSAHRRHHNGLRERSLERLEEPHRRRQAESQDSLVAQEREGALVRDQLGSKVRAKS